MIKEQCPDCHAGEKWIRNGPSGAQETCKHPWHTEVIPSKQKGHVGPDEGDWTFKEWLGFIGAALFVGGACIGGALALRHFYG